MYMYKLLSAPINTRPRCSSRLLSAIETASLALTLSETPLPVQCDGTIAVPHAGYVFFRTLVPGKPCTEVSLEVELHRKVYDDCICSPVQLIRVCRSSRPDTRIQSVGVPH